MKYSELVQFKPIVTVIELKSADNTDKARKLVQDYVMSNDMAEMVNVKILSQLSLENVVDNKGVLLVGNYGTGKSHLMSVISSIAQNEKLLPEARNAIFREEIGALAGRFEVLRIEIGSTTKSLRAIITEEIEKDLIDWEYYGLSFGMVITGSPKVIDSISKSYGVNLIAPRDILYSSHVENGRVKYYENPRKNYLDKRNGVGWEKRMDEALRPYIIDLMKK